MSDDWQVRGVSNAELNRDAERSARWDRERRALKAEVERLRGALERIVEWRQHDDSYPEPTFHQVQNIAHDALGDSRN